jgi:ABC-2 type transport system permease protein
MRLDKIRVLARREFLVRVKSKGFWFGILVLPLFLGAVFVIPTLVLSKTKAQLDLVMVDATGRLGDGVAERLGRSREGMGPGAEVALTVVAPEADREEQRRRLDDRLLGEEIDAWLWIDDEALASGEVEYHARNVSNTFTLEILERALSAEVRELRLTEAGYDPQQVASLIEEVELQTIRVSAEGSRREAGEAGFLFAYALFFMLYMVLLIWGQQVLQGVLEEKTSRVVEVIASAARPFDLMMGKLLGIGAAAFTQFSVWMVTLATVTAPAVVGSLAFLPEGLTIPRITVVQVAAVLLFFVLGFFVYSTMFAAVGAAFNNLQEAQQLAFVPTASIILPIFFLLPVINDPASPLAVGLSMVPLLSPILMPLRVAVEMPPLWQIALSALLTGAFIVLMVWVCGRIYRTGILMYGKKPTVRELWRWVRHA